MSGFVAGIVGFAAGIAFAGLVAWAWIASLRRSHAAELAQAQKAQEAMTGQAMESLRSAFAAQAAELMGKNALGLQASNREQMRTLLDPVEKRFEEFKRAVEEARDVNVKTGASLSTRIDTLKDTALRLGADAAGLANALKGGNKAQGNWGEAVLGQLLEESGLREGVNYETQTSSGAGLIPDVIVNSPDGRALVVDAKTSLTAYLAYCNAKDDEGRAAAAREHVASVRKHIDELSRKDYLAPFRVSGRKVLDVVVMFVPNEAAHQLAMATDPSLGQYGVERGVLIAAPLTLLGFLHLAANAWQADAQTKNQQAIIRQGTLVLERLGKLFDKLDTLGDAIAKVQRAYADMDGLARGTGGAQSLLTPARALEDLGIRDAKRKARAIGE
jgi:DNA recombination protein RmuC